MEGEHSSSASSGAAAPPPPTPQQGLPTAPTRKALPRAPVGPERDAPAALAGLVAPVGEGGATPPPPQAHGQPAEVAGTANPTTPTPQGLPAGLPPHPSHPTALPSAGKAADSPPARGGKNLPEAAAAAASPSQAGAAAPPNPMPPPAMAAALAQQADPAACTLETGGLATPTSKLRVQVFRVNHLTKQLRLDEEDRALQETLRPLVVRDQDQRVVIETVGAVSFSAIRQHMDRFRPHCVHFMGHGSEERLVLVDDDGQSRRYGAAEIATLFSTQPQCFLVVFNCCLSAPIARAVCEQGGVFATIGTSTEIVDSAALAFAKALWGGVLLKPLGAAFTQARLDGPYHLFQGSNPPSPPPPGGPQALEMQNALLLKLLGGAPLFNALPPVQPAPPDPTPALQAMLREQYTSAAFTKIRVLDYAANTAIQLEEIYTRLAIVDAAAQQVRDKKEREKKDGGSRTDLAVKYKALYTNESEEDGESRTGLAVEYDTLYSPKQPSHIDHLFGKPGERTSKRVLVVGRAGIGKTTLSRKIAHLWATGHPPLTSHFDLVFRIALRGEIESAGSIEELLHAVCLGSSDEVSVADLKAALRQAKPRVLLLLDGYDEFRSDGCKLLKRLIQGELNPGFSVLITSRPAAAQDLMQRWSHNAFFAFDAVFELLGFSTAAIAEYVGKYFAAKPATAAGMVAYLEAHPTVQGAARVPVVAALLCILYESHEERGAEAGELPSTLTGIFQEMVEYLLGRARLRLELKGDGDDKARVQAGLEFLEALAWQGMQQGRILFSRGQFEAFAQPPHSIERAALELALELGFLTTAESRRANERVARVEYHFLHLTLQEFLAARHLQRTGQLLAPAPAQRVVAFDDRRSLRMVWQFGCGLLGADAGDLLRTVVETVAKDKRQALLALQCQAESGCPELAELLGRVFRNGRVDLSDAQLSTVELTAVVDVVKRFKIRVLDLQGNRGLGAADADVLGPALRGPGAPGEVRIGKCGLLFIAQLVYLGVAGLRGGTELSNGKLIGRIWRSEMVTLDLSQHRLGPLAAAVAVEALKRNTLESLNLGDIKLTLAEALALAEALKGNTTLTILDLSDSKLGAEGGAALAEALAGNTTLTNLDLSYNNLMLEGGMALAEALKGNTTLTTLNLSRTGLGSKEGAALVEALTGNTTLTNLDLSYNNLMLEGGMALAEALKGNTALTNLDLINTHIGPEAGTALAEALEGNTTLTTLNLSLNRIGPNAGLALAEALTGNTTFTTLNLDSNVLGPEGGAALAEALKDNTTLTTLDLRFNELGSGGGTALAEALKANTTLTSLDLRCNDLGSDAGLALGEALSGNTALTTLNLSCNKLSAVHKESLRTALSGLVGLKLSL